MASAASTRTAAARAFDRVATEYDALASGEIFQLLRARTHAALTACFRPGCRLLEIGCGTGIDTAFLASHGMRLVACDPSEGMVGRTLRRLAHARCDDRAAVLPCGLADLPALLDALADPGGFDGIVSNFGALNCVEDLSPLQLLAARHLRPGGTVVLGLMGRTCAMEALYFTATRRPSLASRRRAPGAVAVLVGGVEVPTFYHRIEDVRRALGRDLSLDRVDGVGVVIPPPYLETRWQTLPAGVRAVVTRLDRVVAPWPPFNRLGDHVLLQFVKRRSADA